MHPRFYLNNDAATKQIHKNAIIAQLKTLRVNDASIKIILDNVEKMPCSTQLLGVLKFLTEITNQSSQCEHFYLHSDYLAEFFCTLSNIGFFAVAYYYHDVTALMAGIFSTISHAIPLKRLNDLDKLAALAAGLNVLINYDVILANPNILIAGAITIGFGALDMLLGRPNKDIFGPTFHVCWHFAAAYALHQFQEASINLRYC